MKISRTVTVDRPLDAVFAYLSDFRTTTEWDPGTVRTTLVSGDGSVGTIYHNVSRFMGNETELEYEVVVLEPNRRFELRGSNKTVDAHDVMAFRSVAAGTEVTYSADFEFKGIAKFMAPLLAWPLKRLGDEAEKGLAKALNRLPR